MSSSMAPGWPASMHLSRRVMSAFVATVNRYPNGKRRPSEVSFWLRSRRLPDGLVFLRFLRLAPGLIQRDELVDQVGGIDDGGALTNVDESGRLLQALFGLLEIASLHKQASIEHGESRSRLRLV